MRRTRLGQHFLVDERVLSAIVEAGELSSRDLVLEVGAGEGVLTERLAQKAGRVVSFEVDPLLFPRAKEWLGAYPHVFLYREDILRVDLVSLLRSFPETTRKCIANLPYGISAAFFTLLLETTPELLWERFVVTVQYEFGEKLLSLPPEGKGNPLSVGLARIFSTERLLVVPPQAFRPPPRVYSLVLSGRRRKDLPQDFIPFFRFVREVFRHRRKILRSVIPQAEPPIPELLGKRAEDLTLEEWERLWESVRVVSPRREGYNGGGERHAEEHLGGGQSHRRQD
jgi:16S rRNA (adenine1518-N6/adenine1519-N6)-dimethyltransferase